MTQTTDTAKHLPEPLMTSELGSFARKTIVERKPQIIARVIADNTYSPEILQTLDDFTTEIATLPIRPLTAVAADAAAWAGEQAKHAGRSWLEVPWYFAETFFYRRLLEIVHYFQPGHWYLQDPFEKQKQEQEEAAVSQLALVWEQLAAAPPAIQFEAVLHSCLWGNRIDLSNYTLTVRAHGGLNAREHRHNIVIDHTGAAIDLLSQGTNRVDFINDNVGIDTLFDLVLADHLLEQGLTDRVVFHLKDQPFFVSDAMPKDIQATISLLTRSPQSGISALGNRLNRCVTDDRLALQTDPFWTSGGAFHQLPTTVRADLEQSDLVVIKGDVNYRRMLDDRHWPHDARLEDIASRFPRPFVMLRTLKGEIIVGLKPGRAEVLSVEDPTWLINVRRGVIHLVSI